MNWDALVLAVVEAAATPIKLQEITGRVRERLAVAGAQDVLDSERKSYYDRDGISIYNECGAATQRLKHAGKIALKRGKGAGWYALTKGPTP